MMLLEVENQFSLAISLDSTVPPSINPLGHCHGFAPYISATDQKAIQPEHGR